LLLKYNESIASTVVEAVCLHFCAVNWFQLIGDNLYAYKMQVGWTVSPVC